MILSIKDNEKKDHKSFETIYCNGRKVLYNFTDRSFIHSQMDKSLYIQFWYLCTHVLYDSWIALDNDRQ